MNSVDGFDRIQWLEPWEPVKADFDPAPFLKELQRELAAGHPLANKTIIPRARRMDCDDWLVELPGTEPAWAVVHPTYSGIRETTVNFPWTVFFSTLTDWVEKCMKRDHDEWVSN